MEETEYSPELRRRNRLILSTFAVATTGAVLLTPAFTDWPMKNAIGIAGLLLVLHACLWWMFASRRAGHLHAPTTWQQWRKEFPTQL